MTTSFLTARQQDIYFRDKRIVLRGVNLGGWLMMEGYLLHARNQPVQTFKKEFKARLGDKALAEFERLFRENFIQENDFANIARLGFNCVRVPFHHRLVEEKAYLYSKSGVKYLDRVVQWAKKFKLFVILDLHGACGAQNHDWHSDSAGRADLWTKPSCQKRTIALWEYLADRYRDESCVAGYDLINESTAAPKKLNALYDQLVNAIRAVDPHHLIFVEGNHWATDLKCLKPILHPQVVLSAHFYEPVDFTFNLVPHLRYPLRAKNKVFGRQVIRQMIKAHKAVARQWNVPLFIGEFGINHRQAFYGEDRWLKDVLDIFAAENIHWTYWTYKAVKNSAFPDGIYSCFDNPPWVNRQGPKLGWANYADVWTRHKKQMALSWQTENFRCNKEIADILQKAAKKP